MSILDAFKTELQLIGYKNIYYFNIRVFLDYLESKGISYDSITYNIVSDFILHLKTDKSPGTVNNYIKAIKCFYRFLIKTDKVTESLLVIVNKFHFLPIDRKIRDYLTVDELDNVVNMAQEFEEYILPEKTAALLWFMYYTGVRRSEVLSLKREDINLQECTFIVRNPKAVNRVKTQRPGIFPPSVAKLLIAYFEKEPEETNCFNMSLDKMYLFFRNCNDYSPNKNFSPHVLRRSYASYLNSQGVDLRTIQQLMGHTDYKTTLEYINPTIDNCFKTYEDKIKGLFKEQVKKNKKNKICVNA